MQNRYMNILTGRYSTKIEAANTAALSRLTGKFYLIICISLREMKLDSSIG